MENELTPFICLGLFAVFTYIIKRLWAFIWLFELPTLIRLLAVVMLCALTALNVTYAFIFIQTYSIRI